MHHRPKAQDCQVISLNAPRTVDVFRLANIYTNHQCQALLTISGWQAADSWAKHLALNLQKQSLQE